MKTILVACALFFGNSWCLGDDASGPYRTTIQRFAWGTIYYDSGLIGPFQFESNTDGFRLRSNQGEVKIQGTEVNGFRLIWEKESLTISQNGMDIDIRGQDKSWSLRSLNGQYTLTSSSPRDSVVFDRNANSFTIKGSKGLVAVSTAFQTLHIQSPLGTTTIISEVGKRTLSGIALAQIPYLGRGVFIPFHGAGILIDTAKVFPMQELGEWIEWKPILKP